MSLAGNLELIRKEGLVLILISTRLSIAAVAVPLLYRNRALIANSAREIFCIVGFGSGAALSIAAICALALCLPRVPVLSIAPKSTTAAIAMGVAERVGGVASITVVVVLLTGFTAAVSATLILDRMGVRDPRARGLAAGICGHALATARMFQIDQTMGAFASLAIGLAGIGTRSLCRSSRRCSGDEGPASTGGSIRAVPYLKQGRRRGDLVSTLRIGGVNREGKSPCGQHCGAPAFIGGIAVSLGPLASPAGSSL